MATRKQAARSSLLPTACPRTWCSWSALSTHRAAPRCHTRLAADRDVLFQIPGRRLGHRRPQRQLRHHGGGGQVPARLDAGGDGRSPLPCLLDTSARALHRRPDDPCADRSTHSPLRRIHAARLSRPLRRHGPEPAPLAPRRRRVCRRGRVAEPSGAARPHRGMPSSALLHDIGVCHSTGSRSLPVGRKGRQPGCAVAASRCSYYVRPDD